MSLLRERLSLGFLLAAIVAGIGLLLTVRRTHGCITTDASHRTATSYGLLGKCVRSELVVILLLVTVAILMFPIKAWEYRTRRVDDDPVFSRLDDPSWWALVVAAVSLLLVWLASRAYPPIRRFPRYEATVEEKHCVTALWQWAGWFLFCGYSLVVGNKGETLYWMLGDEAVGYLQAKNFAMYRALASQHALVGLLLTSIIIAASYQFAASTVAVRMLIADPAASWKRNTAWAAAALASVGPVALSAMTLAPLTYTIIVSILHWSNPDLVAMPQWFKPWPPWMGFLSALLLSIPFLVITQIAIVQYPKPKAFDVVRFNLLHAACLIAYCLLTPAVALKDWVHPEGQTDTSRTRMLWTGFRRLLTPSTIDSPTARLWFQMIQVPFSFSTVLVFFLLKEADASEPPKSSSDASISSASAEDPTVHLWPTRRL